MTMTNQDSALGDWAWQIIRVAVPKAHRETSCLYFAVAAASALGTGWRFRAGGAMLASSGITGWGLSVSPAEGKYVVTADREVDPDDGTYCGHCWVQWTSTYVQPVVDIHEGYYGPHQQADRRIVYHALPSLTRSIKQYHATKMIAVAKNARRDKAFVSAVALAGEQAWAAAHDAV